MARYVKTCSTKYVDRSNWFLTFWISADKLSFSGLHKQLKVATCN